MNAVLISIVTLLSLPQRLEQFVITAFPLTPHGDRICKETEIAPRDSEASPNYLRLPMGTGQVTQPIVINDVILL